jgi:hypothetical protein
MTRADRWLAERHREMVDDLTRRLDLTTGLGEVTIPGRHERLVAELAASLDLDEGLAAILPPAQGDAAGARDVTFRQLTELLAAGDPGRRLLARPIVHSLARSLMEALTRAATMTALRELVQGRLRVIGDVPAEVEQLGGRIREPLDAGLRNATQRTESAVTRLEAFLASGGLDAPDGLHELHERIGALESALSAAVDAASDNTISVLRAMHHAARPGKADRTGYREAHLLASNVEDSLRRGLRLVGEVREHVLRLRGTEDVARRVHEDATAVATLHGFRSVTGLEAADRGDVRRMLHSVDDFIGADLEGADLTGVALEGIRWSDATRWPGGWREAIRRSSVPVGGGVYEIRSGGTARVFA